MSQTTSVGVVGPSYWLHMAGAMADGLDLITKHREVKPGAIPDGVLNSALEFFNLVLQAKGDVPKNPPASFKAYVIAAEAVKRSSVAQSEDMDATLTALSSFVRSLRRPHVLNQDQTKRAKALFSFFECLHDAGQTELSSRRVDLETSWGRIRFSR